MGHYIILGTFDRDGATQLMKSDIDGRLAQAMADEAGGQLIDLWLTTAPYDFVAIIEAEDTRIALTFAVAFGTVARATTTTLAAASPDDVLDHARQSHTRHEARSYHTRHEGRSAHTRHEARG